LFCFELISSEPVSSYCTICGTGHIILVQTRWMNEERTVLWLRQTEHIRGRFRQSYSITVMDATVKLSKWWLQLNQEEPWVQ
jgi:hypothetical protein